MVTVNGLLQDIKKGSVWARHIFSRESPRRSHEKVNDHIGLFLLDLCIMLGQNPAHLGEEKTIKVGPVLCWWNQFRGRNGWWECLMKCCEELPGVGTGQGRCLQHQWHIKQWSHQGMCLIRCLFTSRWLSACWRRPATSSIKELRGNFIQRASSLLIKLGSRDKIWSSFRVRFSLIRVPGIWWRIGTKVSGLGLG